MPHQCPVPMDLGYSDAKKPQIQNTDKEIIYYNSGKKGHFACDCWSKLGNKRPLYITS